MTALDSVVAPVPTAAGGAAANHAHARMQAVHRLHAALAARPDLRPGPEVDALFGRLVGLAVHAPVGTATAPPAPAGLRALCAAGEAELERHWARRIATGTDPEAALAAFPYAANYRRLTRLEVDALTPALTRPVRRVAFLGSGPLPLTGLLLAEALRADVVNVDRDAGAVEDGRRVAAALGATRLSFVQADVLGLELAGFDVVVLAALVGATRADKRAVLAHLAGAMAPGAVLVARSARAARTLLYPPLPLEDLGGFALQAVVHPSCDVVNSIVVARATGRR